MANPATDLASLFKITIIQKLVPNLHKEGYEEATIEPSAAARERVQVMREDEYDRRNPRPDPLRADPLPQPARPHRFDDPLAVPPPNRPIGDFPPPGFDDEYDIYRPRGGPPLPRGSPLGIGHDDLNPPGLGPHDPLRSSFVGGGLPRPGGGSGMYPTFDDPLFGGRGQRGGYDPQAPPGARYDPVGPSDGLPRGGGLGGLRGQPPNPFGGFGDNDFV
jgi:PI31 proteasome regulator